MNYTFNAEKVTNELIQWIRNFTNGRPIVIGISGGKDSTICGMLSVLANGRNKVFGVLMPNGTQSDIQDSYDVCKALQIKYKVINIGQTYKALTRTINDDLVGTFKFTDTNGKQIDISSLDIYATNTPARLRMTTLYAINAALGGFVINTCNGDEDYVGYSTKFGDSAGDFSPLADFTVDEVRAIGRVAAAKLGIYGEVLHLIDKIPDDGMSGKSDEEKLGMTYEAIGNYRRTGECDNIVIKGKIEHMHAANLHKISPMPKFTYTGE